MPKYRVLVRRFVEEVAEVEMEADTPQEAASLAEADVRLNGLGQGGDWTPGDDIQDEEAYAVYAAADAEKRDILWEG